MVGDINGFRASVYQRLRKYPFWNNLQQNIVTLAAAVNRDAAAVDIPLSINPLATVALIDDRLTRRAQWLQSELERRKLTHTALKKAGGPDRKTTKKILAAQPVSENVLKRVMDALKVRRADIP